ncbi:MAG: hypothetical protein H6842_13905 [Rhodospirillaceae bacterium]|nr:hypothetical protein [Rhodospirillaceae bacterium]
MTLKGIGAALAGGLFLFTANLAQAAYATSGWVETSIDLETCLQVGERAVAVEGFSASRGRTSAFGWRGEENIIARCIPEHGLVVIYVYSHQDVVDGILERLRAAYSAAASGVKPRL